MINQERGTKPILGRETCTSQSSHLPLANPNLAPREETGQDLGCSWILGGESNIQDFCTALTPGGSQRPAARRGVLPRWGHTNQAKSILVSSVWGVRAGGRRSPGSGSPALGVGGTAGAAAGFAVVPVAAQVHLDGQGTVGSCLVLAAVICRERKYTLAGHEVAENMAQVCFLWK